MPFHPSKILNRALCVCLFALWIAVPGLADDAKGSVEGLPTIAELTAGLSAVDGLLTTYPAPKTGNFWLRLPAPTKGDGVTRILYAESLRTGLGSNPVGLDRGQINNTHIIDIRRLGNRVLFQAANLRFRADNAQEGERLATQESFAPSVLWAGPVAARDADGSVLVDIAPFLLRDAHGIEATIRQTEQGRYTLDPARSAIDFEACLSFPDNLELEALLTYGQASDDPGELIEQTAPTGQAFSVVQHHSLIRLPDDGFEPRLADPRIGFFGPGYSDYAAPLDASIQKRLIARHRLQKAKPGAARSKAVEPIVYYVDHGAPEPIRSALLDGARWWAEAFEAAGFIDGYRVEVLPEHVHPLDVRYNVIQWVHRSTRGWSYGNAVTDPRTGEIVKGHVSLGSLRVRQDRLIFEGLLGVEKTGSGADDDPIELALDRIRQLAAHEVGHTLGLTHNFAASTYGGRESVMDYPAPWIRPAADGGLDTSRAYGVGVGEWDKLSIRYGYSEIPEGTDTQTALDAIVRDGLDRDILFLTDDDARPPGAADPRASLWDNGSDAVDELEDVLEVRRRALDSFGLGNLPTGQPVAFLQEVLVPIYLYHRYQLDAALKTVGGVEYHYAIKGDRQPVTTPISSERQDRALDVILGILDPGALDLPDQVIELLAPRPWRFRRNPELFTGTSELTFDPLAAASTAADQVLGGLLNAERLARAADLHRRHQNMPGPRQILQRIQDSVFTGSGEGERQAAIRRQTHRLLVHRLMSLSTEALSGEVRFEADRALERLSDRLAGGSEHDKWLAASIDRFFERPFGAEAQTASAPPLPPGSPIGQGIGCGFDHEAPGR